MDDDNDDNNNNSPNGNDDSNRSLTLLEQGKIFLSHDNKKLDTMTKAMDGN